MINPFHLLKLSSWPFFFAIVVIFSFINFYIIVKFNRKNIIYMLLLFILIIVIWFKDVNREREMAIDHSSFNDRFFRLGIILFILSEVIFFVSFFWCYFDFVFSVDIELGGVWPPKGIVSINPFSVPLLNTLILLSSGVTITWAHFSILSNNLFKRLVSLLITLILGVYFLVVQVGEYSEASFNFIRRGYGRVFFLATGFHGFHVLLGCFLILARLVRILALSIEAWVHYGFEFSAWYWHFVDVVWLFLFVFIYWWGN